MSEIPSSKKAAEGRVGAAPIRWSWWAAGFGVSVAMWAGLAFAFGWFF